MSRNRGSTTFKWSPSAAGSSFTIPTLDDGSTVNLVIKPTILLASGTLNWPSAAPDRQTIRISSTGVITLLNNQMGTNNQGILDQIQIALTSLVSGGRGAWWYDAADAMWYRYA